MVGRIGSGRQRRRLRGKQRGSGGRRRRVLDNRRGSGRRRQLVRTCYNSMVESTPCNMKKRSTILAALALAGGAFYAYRAYAQMDAEGGDKNPWLPPPSPGTLTPE